ncbi:MAG TPA: DCC1-like thiol-disulfide oxidoreductase family protein [Terracidiphilus sp.]|jgi:predicted DCC family thiol-disulfide oxidoreductase YuxK|nr:DCC1-like thiol-disulfide oxidoreductase family protein [Terracidiphilus sp.]
MVENIDERFTDLGSRLLVLFDGHCGFCNRTIRWFLRRDRNDRLRFIPSESPRVAALLTRHGFATFDSHSRPDTIVAVRNPGTPSEKVFLRSDAGVALLTALPQPCHFLGTLLRVTPRPIRDLGYRFIARIRYCIWGHYDTCPLPTPAERAHFLE